MDILFHMEKKSEILSAASKGDSKHFWKLFDEDFRYITAIDDDGDTVLHLACYNSEATDLAKQIINNFFHLMNKTNNDGCKPIHTAIQFCNADVFWYLIVKDESLIDAVDKKGDTVLHWACGKFDTADLAKQITDKHPHLLNTTNNKSRKPIHTAAAQGNANVFWYFIEKDESLINAVDEDGDTVLHIACINSDAFDLVKQITNKYPHLIHKTEKDSSKPIHTAAYYGNANVFWYFIEKDKSLIDAVNKYGNTVLHIASVRSDAVDLAKQITDKYPHLMHKTDNNGKKPIHYAAVLGNANIFWYFIDKDESLIDAVDENGDTVLHIACWNYRAVVLAKEITDKYPYLMHKTNNYNSKPIHDAAEYGNADVFWYFIDKDDSLIDAVDEDGKTVLHKASALSNAVNFAKEITDKYPHLMHKTDDDGWKPIDIAAKYGNVTVFWYFIDKDESLIDEVDKNGRTILHHASVQSYAADLAKEIADKYPYLVHKTDNNGCKP